MIRFYNQYNKGAKIMKCEKCNKEIDDNVKFCSDCGEPVKAETKPINRQELEDKIKILEKKISVHKKLLPVIEIAILFVLPIFLSFLRFSILLRSLIAGICAVIPGIISGYKIAKFTREKNALKYNYEKSLETLVDNNESPKEHDSIENKDANESEIQVKSDFVKPTTIISSEHKILNLEEKADKEIRDYFHSSIKFNTVLSIASLVFALILFFAPFFSVIIDEISVYDIAESAMIWNWGKESEILYNDLFKSILENTFIARFLGEGGSEFLVIFIGTGLFISLSLPLGALGVLVQSFWRQYKYNTDKNFKIGTIYKYNQKPKRKLSKIFLAIYATVVLIPFFLPVLNFLFYLPIYFDGFTNGFYIIALICYLLTWLMPFLSPLFIKNVKQASFALAPDRSTK